MSTNYLIPCENCRNENDISVSTCPACGTTQPFPVNVRRAIMPLEKKALEDRYENAVNVLDSKNLKPERSLVEDLTGKHGKAVINTSFSFIWKWLVEDRATYESYRRQLINNSRTVGSFQNDVDRSMVDAFLFGSEPDIIYSALTINEKGVDSYGDVSIFLNIASIEKRTSALETNSFYFFKNLVDTGKYSFGKPSPPGYFSSWYDKHKLVIAKLKDSITSGITSLEIGDLVLRSGTSRANDEFIELYIYGNIVSKAVEKIIVKQKNVIDMSHSELIQLNELKRHFNVEII